MIRKACGTVLPVVVPPVPVFVAVPLKRLPAPVARAAKDDFLPTVSDWMAKSKSTPICSKKLSLTVMNRTSIVTWRSCRRRSCRSRSTISSWTSAVWRMIRLMLRKNGVIEPIAARSASSAAPPAKAAPMP